MKIESVKLKGFIGIKKGLGLDEVSLDLSALSGLVALAGPNGSSKTTWLENLHPFRTLASRKGSLQHHVFLRDSEKALAFLWNGDRYETQVKIDSQSGRGEAFIWKNGLPEIKGKSSEYDHYMRDLLGSEELFFASVFCAQNSEKLSDMTTGKLKALFSEFLRLDKLITYEDLSKRCAVTLVGQAKALEDESQYLVAETKKQTLLEYELPAIQQKILAKQVIVNEALDAIRRMEANLKDIRGCVENNRIHKIRLKDLQAQGAKLTADWNKEKEAASKTIADLKAKVTQAETEIAATSKLIEQRDEIEFSIRKEKELSEQLQIKDTEQKKNLGRQHGVIRTLSINNKKQSEIGSEIRAYKRDPQVTALETSIKNARERMALLDKRDPACTSTTCAFILNALKAKDEIPTLDQAHGERKEFVEAQLRGLEIQLQEIEQILSIWRKEETDLGDKYKLLNGHLNALKEELSRIRSISSMKSQLDTATAKLEGLQRQKSDLTGDILTRKNELSLKEGDYQIALNENTKDMRDVLALVDPLAEEDLQQEESALKGLIAAKESSEKEIAALRGNLAGIDAQIKAIEEKERRLTEIQGKRRIILTEASEWEYLKNACSKDGLRALEIDSVAPTISAYANDLLSRTFGPLFQVRFRTQNDDGKEVLDILAIRDDGTESLIENLSGGERVWILKALRLAMTLVSKEKSGRELGTAYADEEDGALDPENGQNFIQLYRSFIATGGFQDMFYISHKPDCVEMADHVLRFNGGGIEVE